MKEDFLLGSRPTPSTVFLRSLTGAVVLAICISHSDGVGQEMQKQQLKEQAETQLEQMTPEEIDAKIKELGMTRQQAEERARELGIDLSSFLRQKSAHAPSVSGSQAQKKSELSPTSTEAPPSSEKPPVVKPESWFLGPGGLKYFGYEIFSQVPAAFEPNAAGPVDPEIGRAHV